jgi:hypothetical protein
MERAAAMRRFLRLELKEMSHRINGTDLPAKADA